MLKVTAHLLLLAGLAGCATTTAPAAYGNFVEAPIASDDAAMVTDVVKKLTALYPPAQTRFNFQHATPDAFGTELATALREKGYALAEVKPGTKVAPTSAGELALAYIIDQPIDTGLYRVTVLVNSQTLSRVYQSTGGAVAPAGAWVRKE